jgi:hypothetical protein
MLSGNANAGSWDCARGSGGRAVSGGFEGDGGAPVFLVEWCWKRPGRQWKIACLIAQLPSPGAADSGGSLISATGGAVRVAVRAIPMPIFEPNQRMK